MEVKIKHVPRPENSRADALARLVIASQENLDRSIPVEHLTEPSVSHEDEEMLHVLASPSWMDPIREYLHNETLPEDPKEAAKLRARSSRFMILHKNLYKRGFSDPLLKCIGDEDANYMLRKNHKGICGNHIRAQVLAGKALRQEYF